MSAPALGVFSLPTSGGFPDLPTVEHVLPSIRKWPREEETELQLSPVELEAFRVGDSAGKTYLLNKKGPMACALHCWGSQLTACPCGCRAQGLSQSRLEARGLYGVLVESASTGGTRHLHPQEAAALCGLDPNLKWGSESRLALGAVGQLASPVQAVWVFSHALKALQVAQWQHSTVDPSKTLMAYRTWLLARCKYMLTRCNPHFPASETLAHVGIFEKHIALNLHELLSSLNDSVGDRTIQVCWEAFVRTQSLLTPMIELSPPSEMSTNDPKSMVPTEVVTDEEQFIDHGLTASQVAIEASELYQEPTEVLEPPVSTSEPFQSQCHSAIPPKGHASVQIMCSGVLDEAVSFKIDGTPTVDQLQEAEMKLRGYKRKAEYVFENGNEVLSNEVVQAGSSYILDFGHSVDYSQTIAVTSPANSPATPSVSALSSEAFGGSVSGLDPFSVSEEAAQQPNP